MTTRRSHGDGGLHWDETRQRWIATVTIGYTPTGKRVVRKPAGRTKTEARAKLKKLIREHDDGMAYLRATATPSPKPSPTGSTTGWPAATTSPWTRDASSPSST